MEKVVIDHLFLCHYLNLLRTEIDSNTISQVTALIPQEPFPSMKILHRDIDSAWLHIS